MAIRGDWLRIMADVSRQSLLSGPMVDVYVGDKRRHWTLHRNLLSYHAQAFDNSLPVKTDPRKRQDGHVELPGEDATAFELLVKWLYQGKIEDVSNMPMDKKWDYAYKCQQLYLFCDKFGLQKLKNVAIDQFRKGCSEAGLVPGPEEMKPIYEKTSPSSPFRKLVSRIAARRFMDPAGEKDASLYRQCFESSPDFAIDVINAIKDGVGTSLLDNPTEGNPCRYHEHENGESCQKSVKFTDGVKK